MKVNDDYVYFRVITQFASFDQCLIDIDSANADRNWNTTSIDLIATGVLSSINPNT